MSSLVMCISSVCKISQYYKSQWGKLLLLYIILQEYGNTLKGKYIKYLKDGIYELRVKQSTNITRVLYFFYNGENIVFTHGFVKKTDETPPREIERAKKYKVDYITRMEMESNG